MVGDGQKLAVECVLDTAGVARAHASAWQAVAAAAVSRHADASAHRRREAAAAPASEARGNAVFRREVARAAGSETRRRAASPSGSRSGSPSHSRRVSASWSVAPGSAAPSHGSHGPAGSSRVTVLGELEVRTESAARVPQGGPTGFASVVRTATTVAATTPAARAAAVSGKAAAAQAAADLAASRARAGLVASRRASNASSRGRDAGAAARDLREGSAILATLERLDAGSRSGASSLSPSRRSSWAAGAPSWAPAVHRGGGARDEEDEEELPAAYPPAPEDEPFPATLLQQSDYAAYLPRPRDLAPRAGTAAPGAATVRESSWVFSNARGLEPHHHADAEDADARSAAAFEAAFAGAE